MLPYTGVGQGARQIFDPGGKAPAQQVLTSMQACPGGQDALLAQAVTRPAQTGGVSTQTTFRSTVCVQTHVAGAPQSVPVGADGVQAEVVGGQPLLTGKHLPSWQT